MKTHQLDILTTDYFDFDVFSITCTASVYRLINEINQALTINLELTDLLDFQYQDELDFYFPLYSFTHPELNIEINVLQNQSSFQPDYANTKVITNDLFGGQVQQTIKLIPELDNTDYLMLIKGDNRVYHNHTIFETIQRIKIISFTRELFMNDIKDKKSKYNLLF